MPRLKSLLKTYEIEVAVRKRTCNRNDEHIIRKGEKCLVIKENMNRRVYCVACSGLILEHAETQIQTLKTELNQL